MAWVKIPKENHPLFYDRLPRDRRVETLQMFGAAAAKVNGHLFGGLFARSFMVKLGPGDLETALALEGAERFDPMGNGRVMGDSVLMPEEMMDDPAEMKAWLAKAFAHAVTLPKKKAKPAAAKKPKKPAVTPRAGKSADRRASPGGRGPRSPRPRRPA